MNIGAKGPDELLPWLGRRAEPVPDRAWKGVLQSRIRLRIRRGAPHPSFPGPQVTCLNFFIEAVPRQWAPPARVPCPSVTCGHRFLLVPVELHVTDRFEENT